MKKDIPNPEDPTKELELSPGFKVTIGTLSASESLIADDYVGASQNENLARKTYAVCAVRRVGTVQVHPLQNEIEYKRVLDKFEGPKGLIRLNRLTGEFFKFMAEAADLDEPAMDAPAKEAEAA